MFQNLLNKTMFNVFKSRSHRRSKSRKSRSKSLKKRRSRSRSRSLKKSPRKSRSKSPRKSLKKSRSRSKSKGRMSYLLQQAISKTDVRSVDWMRSAYHIFSELKTSGSLDSNLQVFSGVCLDATVAMIRRYSLNIQGIELDYSMPMKYINSELRSSLRILRDQFKETWVSPLFGNCLGIIPFQRQDDMENCLTDKTYVFICNTFIRRLKSWVNQNKNHKYAKRYLTYVSSLENPRMKQFNEQIQKVGWSGARIQQTGRDEEDGIPIYGKKPTGGLDDNMDEYKRDVNKWHDEVTDWENKEFSKNKTNKIKKVVQAVNYENPNAPTRNFKITPKLKLNEPKRRSPKKALFDDWF